MSDNPRVTVLLVDDDPAFITLASRMIGDEHRVLQAGNAPEGFEVLKREAVHLVIVDQRLPGMSGVEFLERVWRLHPKTVRILTSSYADHDAVIDAINRGHVRRYLKKPWTAEVLRNVIAQEAEYVGTVGRLERTVARLRHREQELIKALEEIRSVERMKDDLQANVSHELKTPLVAGMGYVELMLKGVLGPISEEQRRGLSISFNNLARLARIIEDLMVFSRLRFGKEGLEPVPLALADCVAEVVRDMAWERAPEEVRVNVRIPRGLPDVLADGAKLERLLDSLLSNAEKFSPDKVDVTVTAELNGDRVCVRVSDKGQGIPEDQRELIFDRFRMGDESSTRKHAGLGIGLALAREIARAHGSDLMLEETGEHGSVFRFELPLSEARSERPARDPQEGCKVLVVDDHKPTLDLVRHILESKGYQVSAYLKGEDGYQAFADGDFQLVLCDLTLRDTTGLDVIRRITALGRGVPLYTLSARSEPDIAADAVRAGAVGSIDKPFRIDQLLDGVKEAIRLNNGHEIRPHG